MNRPKAGIQLLALAVVVLGCADAESEYDKRMAAQDKENARRRSIMRARGEAMRAKGRERQRAAMAERLHQVRPDCQRVDVAISSRCISAVIGGVMYVLEMEFDMEHDLVLNRVRVHDGSRRVIYEEEIGPNPDPSRSRLFYAKPIADASGQVRAFMLHTLSYEPPDGDRNNSYRMLVPRGGSFEALSPPIEEGYIGDLTGVETSPYRLLEGDLLPFWQDRSTFSALMMYRVHFDCASRTSSCIAPTSDPATGLARFADVRIKGDRGERDEHSERPQTAVTVDLYATPGGGASETVTIEPGVTIQMFGGAGPARAGDPSADWLQIGVNERTGWIPGTQAALLFDVPRRHLR